MVIVCVTAFKAITKSRTDGRIGNMLWKGDPTPMYQSMWYAPGMRKGTAGPCIGTICFPSTPPLGRVRRMHPWQELRTTILQLQCHLWIVTLPLQDCLGQSHQVHQVTHPRVVQINLLHLDTAPKKLRIDFHGGTRILVYKHVPGHPTSGMHGLVFMPYLVCTMLSGEVQYEHTLQLPSNVCQAPLILALSGILSMLSLQWILDGGEVDQRLFGLSTTTPLEKKTKIPEKVSPLKPRECAAAQPRKSG